MENQELRLEGTGERDQAGNEGHFSDTWILSLPPQIHKQLLNSSQQFHSLISHRIVFSHILVSFPNSLIPFQLFLALCFYFYINPDLVERIC